MAEAYFFEDSPPVAEDLRRSMAQWDDQQLAVRLLEAGGYGRVWDQCSILDPYAFSDQDWGVNQQLLVFNQQ